MEDYTTYVRGVREQLGWSQNKLAREMGISAGAVARWEKGTRQPSEMALRLLRLLLERHQSEQAKQKGKEKAAA